jgi:hypothetical protein
VSISAQSGQRSPSSVRTAHRGQIGRSHFGHLIWVGWPCSSHVGVAVVIGSGVGRPAKLCSVAPYFARYRAFAA